MTSSTQHPDDTPKESVTTGTTVATPEGDNEFAPDQPLNSIDEVHQKPPAIDTNKL